MSDTTLQIPRGWIRLLPNSILKRGDKWWNEKEKQWMPIGYSNGNRIEGVYIDKVIIREEKKFIIADVRNEFVPLRLTLRKNMFDEYVVRIKGSPVGHGYFATDLLDARATGIQMAAERDKRHAQEPRN